MLNSGAPVVLLRILISREQKLTELVSVEMAIIVVCCMHRSGATVS